jgi:hypothetical protein
MTPQQLEELVNKASEQLKIVQLAEASLLSRETVSTFEGRGGE